MIVSWLDILVIIVNDNFVSSQLFLLLTTGSKSAISASHPASLCTSSKLKLSAAEKSVTTDMVSKSFHGHHAGMLSLRAFHQRTVIYVRRWR